MFKKLFNIFIFVVIFSFFSSNIYAKEIYNISKESQEIYLKIGDEKTFVIDGSSAEWYCNDDDVISLEMDGSFRVLSEGEADVIAFSEDGELYSFVVKVTKSIEKIYFSEKSLKLKKGESSKLELKSIPEAALENEEVRFTSSDKKVAIVSKNGTVRATGEGEARITAVTSSKKIATIKIEVNDALAQQEKEPVLSKEEQKRLKLRKVYDNFSKDSVCSAGNAKLSFYISELFPNIKLNPFNFNFVNIDNKVLFNLEADVEISGIGMYFGIRPFCIDVQTLDVYSSYSVVDDKLEPLKKIDISNIKGFDTDDFKEFLPIYRELAKKGFDYSKIIDCLEEISPNSYSCIFYIKDDDDISLIKDDKTLDNLYLFRSLSNPIPKWDDLYVIYTCKVDGDRITNIVCDFYDPDDDMAGSGKILTIEMDYNVFGNDVFSKNDTGKYKYIPSR